MDNISRFPIRKKLLSTGFSDIYIAEDPENSAKLAVKVFHPKGKNQGSEAKYGPEFWRERFIDEADIMASFEHPHIVSVVESGATEEGEPYLVMPFMEASLIYEIGKDPKSTEELDELPNEWKPRALSPRRAVEVWRQLLLALSALHARNMVHRDIKPQNLLLDSKQRGTAYLCDFGMVKVPDSEGSRSGLWIGTLDYISPEQRKSAKEVDARSDVYSAGALLYRMLSGKLAKDNRVPLRGQRFGIPQELATLIDDCLRKRRKERPSDAGEALVRLDSAVPDISALPEKSKIARRAAAVRGISAEKKTNEED